MFIKFGFLKDDTAAVWDANQKRWYNFICFVRGFIAIRQHLHIVGKHVDSVHCLAWNCSSDLLASGDMSGRIVCTLVKDSIEIEPSTLIIEDCQSTSEQQQQQKQMLENQEEEEQENSFEHIRWLLWHPSANGILFAGSGDGSIWMWLVILNETNSLNVQQFKNAVCVSEVNLPGSCTGAMDLHLSGNMAAF
uniref:WD_REPEATS_REGION domain-containing protein n=1 Tax=Meloidogyne floridensis TaxID=298350 RepID=A0A915NHI8_9BILA